MSEEYTIPPERFYNVVKTTLENNIMFFKLAAEAAFEVFYAVSSAKFEAQAFAKKCRDYEIELPSSKDKNSESSLKHNKSDFNEFAEEIISGVTKFVREGYDEISNEATSAVESYLSGLEETKVNTNQLFGHMIKSATEFTL